MVKGVLVFAGLSIVHGSTTYGQGYGDLRDAGDGMAGSRIEFKLRSKLSALWYRECFYSCL